MKNLFLRCALVGSMLVAGSPCNQLDSCISWPEWDDTRIVFFNPELGNDSTGLRPFFYSTYYLFPNGYDAFPSFGNNSLNDYRQNCREWQAYMGGKIDLDDIHQVIYGNTADLFTTAYKTETLHDFLPGNTFLKALQKPAYSAALRYLDFAKRFEFQQSESGSDPWDEHNNQNWQQQDSMLLDELTEEAHRGLSTAPDAFLRQRWAYQRINTLYYQGKDGAADSCKQIFNRYFNLKQDKTILLPWALLKLAEINPDTNEANYQFALVFDRCQSKRQRTVQRFRSADAEKAMPYARNNREKAAILTLKAVQFPGRDLNTLKQIGRLSPESPYVPLLITREINKLEDWLLTPRLAGVDGWHPFYPYRDYDADETEEHHERRLDRWQRVNAEKDLEYLHTLRQVVADLERQHRKKAKVAPFLQLALSHLYYMEGRKEDAWRTLQGMRPSANPRWTIQKNIQEVLLLPSRADVRQRSTQQALYRRLNYIRQHASQLTEPTRQLSRLYLALSHAFYAKKDIVKAGLIFGRASGYTAVRTESHWDSADALNLYDNLASLQDLEALQQLLAKKNKTPFEEFFTQPFQKIESEGVFSEWFGYRYRAADEPVPTPAQLHELAGMFAMRDGNLKRAVAEFSLLDSLYWDTTGGVCKLDIFGATNFIAADTLARLPYNNKYLIAKKMLDLQREAIRNPAKRAENYYLLGNAWYHCSYWGVASEMITRHSSGSDTDRPDPHRRSPSYLTSKPDIRRYGPMYYRCARAAQYFRKSLAARPGRDLAARAYYMLAECDGRSREMTRRHDPESRYEIDRITSPMFKIWEKRYGKTLAYRECLEACPDLRTYLGK